LQQVAEEQRTRNKTNEATRADIPVVDSTPCRSYANQQFIRHPLDRGVCRNFATSYRSNPEGRRGKEGGVRVCTSGCRGDGARPSFRPESLGRKRVRKRAPGGVTAFPGDDARN